MSACKYRVVWADDDIDSLLNSQTQKRLDAFNVEVLQRCYNSKELESYLHKYLDVVDAVIVDANFNKSEIAARSERDLGGLIHVSQFIESVNEKKTIPFYLYTGRRDLIDNPDTDEGLYEYFAKRNRIFEKGRHLDAMLEQIGNDIDRLNTPEHKVDNFYQKELNYIKTFDQIANAKAYPLMRELLVRIYDGSLSDTEKYFNQIRCEVLEKMNLVAAKFGIVPEGLSLNDFSRFLCKDITLPYTFADDEVMPSALKEVIRYVVRMTQDGSHGEGKLALHLHQYVVDKNDTIIIRSLCFATIELLAWFMTYLMNHTDKERNVLNWYKN